MVRSVVVHLVSMFRAESVATAPMQNSRSAIAPVQERQDLRAHHVDAFLEPVETRPEIENKMLDTDGLEFSDILHDHFGLPRDHRAIEIFQRFETGPRRPPEA